MLVENKQDEVNHDADDVGSSKNGIARMVAILGIVGGILTILCVICGIAFQFGGIGKADAELETKAARLETKAVELEKRELNIENERLRIDHSRQLASLENGRNLDALDNKMMSMKLAGSFDELTVLKNEKAALQDDLIDASEEDKPAIKEAITSKQLEIEHRTEKMIDQNVVEALYYIVQEVGSYDLAEDRDLNDDDINNVVIPKLPQGYCDALLIRGYLAPRTHTVTDKGLQELYELASQMAGVYVSFDYD